MKLDLWNSVEKTDPKYTKEFKRSGGFKGTAINPTYLARKATEAFGPAGIGWGWTVLSEELMVGAPITDHCHELVHVLHVELWYRPTQAMREQYGLSDDFIARLSQYGATTFVSKNSYGFFTDEETKKKSLTDGIGKCLSLLGFSSDVHLGLYDDNKYVNDRRAEVAHHERQKIEEVAKEIEQHLQTLSTKEAISAYFDQAMTKLSVQKGTPVYTSWRKVFKERIDALETTETAA